MLPTAFHGNQTVLKCVIAKIVLSAFRRCSDSGRSVRCVHRA